MCCSFEAVNRETIEYRVLWDFIVFCRHQLYYGMVQEILFQKQQQQSILVNYNDMIFYCSQQR